MIQIPSSNLTGKDNFIYFIERIKDTGWTFPPYVPINLITILGNGQDTTDLDLLFKLYYLGNGGYNFNYMNDKFSLLYKQNYPSSMIGFQLSLPIFQGGKRYHEIEKAELSLHRNDYDLIALENSIKSEYTEALAGYKSNLSNLIMLKENIQLAREVYSTIQLQYKSGVKSYLEVIIAETDLRNTQTNYLNSLYDVLSSKLDVEKALGIVQY